ncbi:hypothetical protein AEP_02651 [Curvibacter sp. AEP1-3]|uniref:hypothetical protein n=1 Tax=Curvibacter sp. AEP1-3 TaxID=1844971 RepID=UPI000B3C4B5B|nr:hypothetical protein [Curvibacter sp. AEP1-3]ARV19577.1 hypothetical protein AEP_02651 [Curvibacter sp. AEP1-3]
MKDFDFKGVIQVITDAKPSHLALVSFLVLPLVANYWLEALIKLFPTPTQELKYTWLGLLGLTYVFCLGWLLFDNHKANILRTRRDQIAGRMIANGWTRINFDSARKALTKNASDAEIIAVIDAFPKTLRFLRVKKKDDNKNYVLDSEGKHVYVHGIGLLASSDAEAADDA